MLKSDFVLGWKNIINERYVGRSFGYTSRQSSVGTTNGAGPHNVQIFVLSPEGVVLHALPGFWHPEDLADELRLAKAMQKLWESKNHTWVQKRKMFRRMQLAAARHQSKDTYARSTWQSFDEHNERARLARGPRDTFQSNEDGYLLADRRGNLKLKPINVLVHERMANRGFVWFDDFDIAEFIDYGNRFYDNNRHVDRRGRQFNFRPQHSKKRSKSKRDKKTGLTKLRRSLSKKSRRKRT
ncbi:MAG: hypothetical protein V3U11_09165 [Planctomycetota bacterium]